MLVDRLSDDGFDPAIKTFRTRGMGGWKKLGNRIPPGPHLPQQRPDAARRHAERFGRRSHVSRGSGPIGQAHNQVAPPYRRCPIGIAVARLVHVARQRASQLRVARQRDPQGIGRDLFTSV